MNRPAVSLACLVSIALSLAACDDLFGPPEDACDAAKKHLCEKLPGQGCSTATMGNAVADLKLECGDAEAAAYIAQVEPACRAKTLTCGAAGCGPAKTFQYLGTAEADGRVAHLELTFTGAVVTGKLVADPVCSGSVRLTRTEIFIRNGTLSGGSWETASSVIQGSWDGADYDCGGAKMAGYPEAGSVTITVSGGKVYLERISGAGKYAFPAQGLVYTPQPCGNDGGSDGGFCPGSSISDAGPNPLYVGDLLTISGSGFGSSRDAGQVLFGSTQATSVLSWANTKVEVWVPSVSEGLMPVEVRVNGKSCKSFDNLQVFQGGCVSAGTRVSLAGGTEKPIEQILPGDRILALDPESKRVRPAVVKKVLVHRGRSYTLNSVRLSKGQSLEVTSNHPVLTQGRQWVPVELLRPGEIVYTLDPSSRRAVKAKVLSIVRDESQAEVVYNLSTTAGNYFANELLVHNKCLGLGSLIDTPAGPVPVESVHVGQWVYGEANGARVPTRVTHAYAKTTLLPTLPGKRLGPHLSATINHRVQIGTGFIAAGETKAPDEAIAGTVYDLDTETGNYFAGGLKMTSGE